MKLLCSIQVLLCHILFQSVRSQPPVNSSLFASDFTSSHIVAGPSLVRHTRGVAYGCTTCQGGPIAGPVGDSCAIGSGPSGCGSSGCAGRDFNPQLLGGRRGNAGIKARLNQRAFQYASTILYPILDQQIRRARIPPITQNLPAPLMGCIIVNNIYVSRYCPPRRVTLYPACPNRLLISVQGVDVGLTGNLGGQVNILIPIAIFGIVQINIHQLSITVALVVDRGPTGAPYLRMDACSVQFAYLDFNVQDGGLVGDIANSFLRGQLTQTISGLIPGQLCGQIPNIINEQINSKLGGIPQSISLTQIIELASSSFDIGSLLSGLTDNSGGGQCSSSGCQQCQTGGSAPSAVALPPAPPAPQASAFPPPVAQLPPPASASYDQSSQQSALPPAPHAQPPPPVTYQEAAAVSSNTVAETPAPVAPPPDPPSLESYSEGAPAPQQSAPAPVSSGTSYNAALQNRAFAARRYKTHVPVSINRHIGRVTYRERRGIVYAVTSNNRKRRNCAHSEGGCTQGSGGGGGGGGQSSVGGLNIDNGPDPCADCPKCGANAASIVQTLLQSLDLSKLSNIYLTIQLLQSYATCNDFTIELNGEFSPGGQGGTPFGAFPMYFPRPVGDKMAEILLSDWTINTLFYHLHKADFLALRLGPETLTIGPFLKTTCGEEGGGGSGGCSGSNCKKVKHVRQKRQACCGGSGGGGGGGGPLGDLGLCLGDLLPGLSRYPNQRLVIVIRTARAPSIQLSSCNGGVASGDIAANVDFYLADSNQHIATISIYSSFYISVAISGNRLSGRLQINELQITEPSGTLGIKQSTLDQFSSLGKELITKAANDFLGKGITLNVPSSLPGLPLNLVDPEIRIVDHALWIGSDFTISPSALSQLGGSGGGGYGGGSCRRRFFLA